MGIMDNEGHDPMGFGNVRPAQVADRPEEATKRQIILEDKIDRLRTALHRIIGIHPGSRAAKIARDALTQK